MKTASLALPPVALAIVIACGGGTGTVAIPSGPDPAPTTGDKPPSSTDPAPSSTDPLGDGGHGNCLTCSGSYRCGTGSQSIVITASESGGVCHVRVEGLQTDVTVDLCTGKASNGVIVTETADGIQYCETGQGGQTQCIDCPAVVKMNPGIDAG